MPGHHSPVQRFRGKSFRDATLPAMSARPTVDQINAALKRAADAAREHVKYPDRVLALPLPKHASERFDERWWKIGYVRVLGQQERWDVLLDPETNEGRLRR
jgi:hypothetical protein